MNFIHHESGLNYLPAINSHLVVSTVHQTKVRWATVGITVRTSNRRKRLPRIVINTDGFSYGIANSEPDKNVGGSL